jgi:cell division protein FtsW
MTEVADRTTASVRHSRTSASIRSAGGKRAVFILVIVAMLLTIGLGAMLSASSVASIKANGDQFELFTKQVIWVALGMAALVLTSFIPYRIWQRLALVMFLATILGLIATLVVGSTRGGATRWIVVGPVTLQVAEFAKFATIVLVATALSKKEALLSDVRHLLAPLAVILLPLIFLLLAQPDFGTVLLILGPVFVMLFASSVPVGFVFSLGVIGAAAMGAAAMAAPYRKARLLSFLDPFASAGGDGFQAVQSMVAFGTGGLFGVGLGQSRARWSWLPNAHTDFIFAIIGEETGFAGAFIVITLFTMLAAVGVSVAYRAPDTFGRLLAIGIVSWMTLQAIINIGGVVAVLPITGVPLPFISSGGNAMLVNLAAIGVLLNIARTSNVLDTENV